MKEINKNQEGINLPPAWCGSICRNAMNQVCVEQCAPKRDCSRFEACKDLNLINLPRFPLEQTKEMTKEERFTVVVVYMAKVIDHLKGVEDEPSNASNRRSDPDNSRSIRLPENFKVEDLLSGFAQTDTSPASGPECKD